MTESEPPSPVPRAPPAAGTPERAKPTGRRTLWWLLGFAVVVGVGYGLLTGWTFAQTRSERDGPEPLFDVMSVSFLFGVPLVLGFVVAWVAEWRRPLRPMQRFALPYVATIAALGAALIFAGEGTICVLFWLPLFFVMATLGSGLAYASRKVRSGRGSVVFASVLLLPYVASPVEQRVDEPHELRTVVSSIEIAADPETVWRRIERVPAIAEEEHSFSWSHLVGFPRPIEARLSGEGVGAVRHATFEGGVLFVETVDVWQPPRALAFSIRADTASIPPTTLDPHVTVGGRHFDVLRGAYEIVPLGPRRVRLVLTSEHRLSTRFNFYARLCTDFVMSDVQEYILAIIKRRCER